MVGRTPGNVMVVRPVRDGVISEFDVTQVMLEYFIGKVHEQSVVPLPRPRVVVGIPTGVTEVEKRAVYDAVMASGARAAMLIEEPIAAAMGAGLPISEVRRLAWSWISAAERLKSRCLRWAVWWLLAPCV